MGFNSGFKGLRLIVMLSYKLPGVIFPSVVFFLLKCMRLSCACNMRCLSYASFFIILIILVEVQGLSLGEGRPGRQSSKCGKMNILNKKMLSCSHGLNYCAK